MDIHFSIGGKRRYPHEHHGGRGRQDRLRSHGRYKSCVHIAATPLLVAPFRPLPSGTRFMADGWHGHAGYRFAVHEDKFVDEVLQCDSRRVHTLLPAHELASLFPVNTLHRAVSPNTQFPQRDSCVPPGDGSGPQSHQVVHRQAGDVDL